MGLSSTWESLVARDRRNLYIALTLPIVGISAARFIKSFVFARLKPDIIRSPRQSLELLKANDAGEVPYPPDALPGARDVDTPYGNIRVYEWGPENGRKVMCIHGISTPSVMFAEMGKLLVERGCRVILYDLFGRGYSDAPDPRIYRQDMGLWTSQILLILASSKLSWTGADRFTLIGYSLGGGIAAAFTSMHPELVESLTLIAPGGLLRPIHISRSSRLLYGNLLPEFLVRYFVGRRLRGDRPTPPGIGRDQEPAKDPPTAPANIAESEVPDHPAHARDSDAPLFPDRPQLTVATISRAVSWQVDAHPGFLRSFISSIKYSPVCYERERWKLVGDRCAARRASAKPEQLPGLDENKVLMILGIQDPVIIADEIEEDATAAMGKENLKVVRLKGAHDVPVVNARGCMDAITEFWGNSHV